MPEATHHMLPEALGTGAYSLLAQKTRPSLLIECTVGADGLVAACEPRVGYARLAANLCYEDCETALDGGESPASPYLEQLRQALELARAHQERRIEKGAVIIERPDITINLEGAGENITVSLDEDPLAPKAHLLVSELMVLTNAALAAWAKEHGVTRSTGRRCRHPKEFPASGDALEIAQWSKRWPRRAGNQSTPARRPWEVDAPSTPPRPLSRYDQRNAIISCSGTQAALGGRARHPASPAQRASPLSGQAQRFRPRYWKRSTSSSRATAGGPPSLLMKTCLRHRQYAQGADDCPRAPVLRRAHTSGRA
ncbi:MAG: RNB domain-containing ribonuclease [Bilophila wadsworthia]